MQIYTLPGLCIVWSQSTEVLCEYLVENSKQLEKRRVIELGAGVGICSILAALCNAEVVATEQDVLIPLIKKNVQTNTNSQHSIKVESLNWGEDVQKLKPPFDFILASDVVYQQDSFVPLIETLSSLSDVDTKILLSYKKRSAAESNFFDLLSKKFTYTQMSAPLSGRSVLFMVKKKPRFWLLEQGNNILT